MQNNPNQSVHDKLHINPFVWVFCIQWLASMLFVNKYFEEVPEYEIDRIGNERGDGKAVIGCTEAHIN